MRDWILDYFEKHYKYGDKIEVSVDTASKIAESLNARMGNAIYHRYHRNNIVKWHDAENYPKTDKKIIVKDKYGNTYNDHTWNGHRYYEWIEHDDGTGDGFPTDVEVVKWRYQ